MWEACDGDGVSKGRIHLLSYNSFYLITSPARTSRETSQASERRAEVRATGQARVGKERTNQLCNTAGASRAARKFNRPGLRAPRLSRLLRHFLVSRPIGLQQQPWLLFIALSQLSTYRMTLAHQRPPTSALKRS